MTTGRRFQVVTIALGSLAFVHGLLTWPSLAVLAFFLGGGLLAFLAEAVVINRGWLEHHIRPKVLGVPVYVLFGWTGVVYVAFRIALFVFDGGLAVVLAATLATVYDLLTDYRGVADGHWTYTDAVGAPRVHGVPWWNVLGWFLVSGVTAALATPFL